MQMPTTRTGDLLPPGTWATDTRLPAPDKPANVQQRERASRLLSPHHHSQPRSGPPTAATQYKLGRAKAGSLPTQYWKLVPTPLRTSVRLLPPHRERVAPR